MRRKKNPHDRITSVRAMTLLDGTEPHIRSAEYIIRTLRHALKEHVLAELFRKRNK